MYDAIEYFKEKITMLLLWFVQKINLHKDERLSFRLHQIADLYSRRPLGYWDEEKTNSN
jgi:hypothetical protein